MALVEKAKKLGGMEKQEITISSGVDPSYGCTPVSGNIDCHGFKKLTVKRWSAFGSLGAVPIRLYKNDNPNNPQTITVSTESQEIDCSDYDYFNYNFTVPIKGADGLTLTLILE